MNQMKIAAEIMAECRFNPEKFVDSAYPWGVEGTPLEHHKGQREWQREINIEVKEHLASHRRYEPLRISRSSGHGIGKSAEISWLMQWAMGCHVDAKGVLTANTESQLRTKTWPEMRKWYNMLAVRDLFRVDNTVYRANDPAYEMTWRFDAIPWSATNPEAFAGLHNEGKIILALYDEASAIDDKIWEVTEGAMTDQDTIIIWVVFGNPTRPTGRFYQTFNLHRHRWSHKQIDSRRVEGTNKKQLDEWVEDHGEDSDFVRVRVRGQFPRAGSNQLIGIDVVTAAQEADISPHIHDPLILGVDCARFGDDEAVAYTRKGRAAGFSGRYAWRGLSNVELANEIIKLILEHHPHYVNIDGGGPGGGVVDIIRDRGFPVHEVLFGGSPTNDDYLNVRAEIWCNMRDWLEKGGCIPWDDSDLANDLINQTYQYSETRANAMMLTPKSIMKRDGLPSPDRGDALACTFAIEVEPVTQIDRGIGDIDTAEMEYDPGWE